MKTSSTFSVLALSLLSLVISSLDAKAAPILNRGAPAGEGILVYPDHLDKNLYYINPVTMQMARNEANTPLFSYTEYKMKDGSWGAPIQAVIQVMFVPSADSTKVTEAMENIRKVNPSAVFSAIPFNSSKLVLTPNLEDLITPDSCTHPAGVMGQLQSCTMDLTPQGRRVLRAKLAQGIVFALNFDYVVSGMIERPDGSFESQNLSMSVGGYVGGNALKDHPELFRTIGYRGMNQ